MKIKVVVCNCNGLKFEPENLDMNSLPYEIEGDVDIEYAVTHPQLCGRGGTSLLRDLLKASKDDPETYILAAGCDEEPQWAFLGYTVKEAGFPRDRFISVSIRGCNHASARDAILDKIGAIIANRGTFVVDGFDG